MRLRYHSGKGVGVAENPTGSSGKTDAMRSWAALVKYGTFWSNCWKMGPHSE